MKRTILMLMFATGAFVANAAAQTAQDGCPGFLIVSDQPGPSAVPFFEQGANTDFKTTHA